MIEIRPIQPEDHASIRQIHQQAFGGATEARLVELLHANNKAPISLVATLNGPVVAHILFSPVSLDPPQSRFNAVGLAPVSVLPEYQRQGIGSRLIREGLRTCGEAGYVAVVVLGDPAYYSRFGFVRASDFGLGNEYNVDEEFMVMELKDGALNGVSGTVKYQAEFLEAGG